jgi:hypothetical protein
VAICQCRDGREVRVHGGADPVTGKQPADPGRRKKTEKEDARQGRWFRTNIGGMHAQIYALHTPNCKQKMCVNPISEQLYPVRHLLRPAVCKVA